MGVHILDRVFQRVGGHILGRSSQQICVPTCMKTQSLPGALAYTVQLADYVTQKRGGDDVHPKWKRYVAATKHQIIQKLEQPKSNSSKVRSVFSLLHGRGRPVG